MVRVEQVNPCEFPDSASQVLEESWPAPHVRYTPQYLRWQFTFPGPLPSLGVAAFEGEEPVAFGAATPRRARFRGHGAPVYIVSFVSVRPAWRGRGVAGAIYAELLRHIRQTDSAVVTFAETGSAGQRRLLAAYDAAGFHVRALGEYPVYGFVVPADAPASGSDVECTLQLDRLLPLIGAADDSATIRHDPDDAALRHYAADPRSRRAVLLRSSDGAQAGAMTVRPEMVLRGGIDVATVVESPYLPRPSADLVRDLFISAAREVESRATPAIVTAPNLAGIEPEVLRSAGLRRTRSVFTGYACAPAASHPFLQADSADFEVM